MNDYEERLEEKRERYERLAQKNRDQAQQRRKSSDDLARVMNGQPILIGHHSEKRHRRDRDRMWDNMGKSIKHDESAEYYERRAANVGKGGISSDDPDAVKKLKAKLEGCERNQECMKKGNKAIRLKDTAKGDAILTDMGLSAGEIHELRNPRYGGTGYKGWQLSNNNANIRRIKKRIEELKNAPTETTEVVRGDIRLVENVEENRVQLIFPDKPEDDVRKLLRSRGFVFSRRNMAWQRKLNSIGIYTARQVLETLTQDD